MPEITTRYRFGDMMRRGAALGLLFAMGCGGDNAAETKTTDSVAPPSATKPVPVVKPATAKNPLEKPFDPRERLKSKGAG
jgi:hypothetical protein